MGESGRRNDRFDPRQRADTYVLKLYITGATPSSQRAVSNARRFCEEFLDGKFELEVIDILRDPTVAKSAQLIVAPTLVKELPLPVRRFIGDLSQTERLVAGFDIR